MRKITLFILFFILFISNLSAQNLLTNGNFNIPTNGNGFSLIGAGYNFITAPYSGNTNAGDYTFTTNPQPVNTAFFLAGGDHTTGTGNMMVIDGNGTGGNQRFWRAGSTGSGVCGLTIGKTYNFTYWIKTINAAGTRASVGIQFNNTSTNALIFGSTSAPLSTAGWQRVTYSFVPNNACVNIELWNTNTDLVGNDFAVDDFSVTSPLIATASIITPTCPGLTNGSLSVYGNGGLQPYVTYSISGTASATNTSGVFTGLAPGPYSVSVTDSSGTIVTQGAITIGQSPNLTTSFNSTICQGSSTTLSASGGTTYTWTASPLDPTLIAPTSSNPTVSPTVATTYTVTSPVTAPKNLVYNGNFTLGNRGFSTDYQFLTTSTSVGVQGAYGVVFNPSTWFAPFSNCGDHTSGLGNMLVVDGSVTNAGNDRLWCQTIPVTPSQTYTFSYWVQTLATPNPASIETLINGTSQGIGAAPTAITCGNWTQYTYTWNSGASTTAILCLYDRTTTVAGNDFAIDDITFTTSVTCLLSKNIVITPVALPTATISGTTSICPNGTTTLSFTGTPGASVSFSASDTGSFFSVILNSSGNATFVTPPITEITTFNLESANTSPAGCVANLTGSATVSININGCATVLGGDVNLNDNIEAICSVGECRNLTSNYSNIASTSQYSVSTISYCPQAAFENPTWNQLVGPGLLNNQGNPMGDDDWSPSFNLTSPGQTIPFKFCFFNNSYTNINVGTNGVIAFNNTQNGCPWSYNQSVPSAGFPIKNAIFGVYQDTDFSVTPPTGFQSTANYQVIGTYPCRKFVANFSNLPQFSCGNGVGLQTSQIVLYEVSNIIEVYVQRRVPCTGWNGGNGVIGIINLDGSLGYTPNTPNRNTGNWSAFNEAYRFTPTGPNIPVTFQWLNGTTQVSTSPNITVCPTVTTTYTAEATYNVCNVETKVRKDVLVEVFPDLTISPVNLTQCSTTFNLTANTATILGSLNPGNYTIAYHTNNADAITASNPIGNASAFISNGQTIYMSIQAPGGCNLVKSFNLIISCTVCETITNPSSTQTLCLNGDPSLISVNTTFTGTDVIRFVYFNSPQTGSAMYTGGTLLANATPTGTIASYNPGILGTTGSLPNAAGTYYVYAIVNPAPADATCRPFQLIEVIVNNSGNAGADGGTNICGSSTTPINLFDLITSEQSGGTWTQSSGSGGTFDAVNGTFTPSVGATTSTFLYTVSGITPCPADTSLATVTISAQLDAGTDGVLTVCDNTTTPINLFNIITGEQSGGIWTQTGTGGTFNPTAGTFIPASGATTVVFTYTLTGTSPCVTDTSTATITVNQQPNAGTDGTLIVCETNGTQIDLFSLITGEQSGGVWTQSGTGGIFNATNGTFIPAVGATNNVFTYSLTGTSPCINDSSTVTLTINPQPNAGTDVTLTICDSSTTQIDLFSLITGEQSGGVWTTTVTGGTFNAATGTYSPAIGAISGTFTYTLSGTSPCINDTSTVTVTINPQPNAGTDGVLTVCDSNTAQINLFNLITGEQSGGVWSTTVIGGTLNPSGGTYIPAVGATSGIFTYTITGTSPCISDSSSVTLTINPSPNAGADGSTSICETSTTQIDLFSLITGEQTGGTWTLQSGTGGTFTASNGTFTPAVGATTSVFLYTVS
uniref:beta strand repeat-containing protein n=1 Tax=Flavobacterium sp. TaxID=239 RepID=UPI00375149AB